MNRSNGRIHRLEHLPLIVNARGVLGLPAETIGLLNQVLDSLRELEIDPAPVFRALNDQLKAEIERRKP